MKNYLSQLLDDIEATMLERWNENPPHTYQMGMFDPYVKEPPKGWKGPGPGFAHEDGSLDAFFAGLEEQDVLADPLPVEERPATDLELPSEKMNEPDPEFEATIEEVEKYLHDAPVKNMFYHFGMRPAQFPPANSLSDDDLNKLTYAICRLWAAFNFMPTLPQNAPVRVVYPLLIERMHKPAFVFERGIAGVEFCNYEPKECPFGEEWCSCREFLH